MLHKDKRSYDPRSLPPGKRLRANLQDAYSSNPLSGRRTQELINDAADAGVQELHSLRKPVGPNAARNLKTAFLKRCQWPEIYWAQTRVWNAKAAREEIQWLGFMLPHEYVATLAKYGNDDVLHSTLGFDPLSKEHLEKCQRKACPGGGHLLGLGLWGDGVPVNYDRTESVETFSMNLPGQGSEYHTLRLPLTAISRKQISRNTWHDIMEVLRWSLAQCWLGTFPTRRHDASPWQGSDRRRSKCSGQTLGTKAALVEVRGDWKFFGETFGFPKHNTKAGCCWKCQCRPDEVLPIYYSPPQSPFL